MFYNPKLMGFLGGTRGSKFQTRDRIRAKSLKVQRWRKKNKMARRSRRINKLRERGLNLK